jgi:NAD(P)H-dependent nitrite reductase small subunit
VTEAETETVRVASRSEIPRDSSRLFDAWGRKVAVFDVNGRLFAIDDVCPHRGGPLSQGDIEDGQVFCPLHAWAFDLETGQMRGNPSCRVPVYSVVVHGDDVLVGRPAD